MCNYCTQICNFQLIRCAIFAPMITLLLLTVLISVVPLVSANKCQTRTQPMPVVRRMTLPILVYQFVAYIGVAQFTCVQSGLLNNILTFTIKSVFSILTVKRTHHVSMTAVAVHELTTYCCRHFSNFKAYPLYSI
jgi:uncharacterized membrane protein